MVYFVFSITFSLNIQLQKRRTARKCGWEHEPAYEKWWMSGPTCPHGLPLFPELDFPCVLWEGPSLLFSSHNLRLLQAAWPPSSHRVEPAEPSGHGAPLQAASETGASARHTPSRARGSLQSFLPHGWGCLGSGGGSCLFDPFSCSRDKGPCPAAHFFSWAHWPTTMGREWRNTPVLECDNSPMRLVGVEVVSGFHVSCYPCHSPWKRIHFWMGLKWVL